MRWMAGSALLAVTPAGCAPATMDGLAALAPTTEVIRVNGVGIGGSGAFRLSDGRTGRFTRSLATRADAAVGGQPAGLTHRGGRVGFALNGAGALASQCRVGRTDYRERSGRRGIEVETLETVEPFALSCRFTRDGVAVDGGYAAGRLPVRGGRRAWGRRGEPDRRLTHPGPAQACRARGGGRGGAGARVVLGPRG